MRKRKWREGGEEEGLCMKEDVRAYVNLISTCSKLILYIIII